MGIRPSTSARGRSCTRGGDRRARGSVIGVDASDERVDLAVANRERTTTQALERVREGGTGALDEIRIERGSVKLEAQHESDVNCLLDCLGPPRGGCCRSRDHRRCGRWKLSQPLGRALNPISLLRRPRLAACAPRSALVASACAHGVSGLRCLISAVRRRTQGASQWATWAPSITVFRSAAGERPRPYTMAWTGSIYHTAIAKGGGGAC